MIETILHKGNVYPKFQSTGNAMRFAAPFFREVANGSGCDVGCCKPEWGYVDKNGTPALAIDPAIEGCEYDALNLPVGKFDFLVSSHMLEHTPSWIDILDYWHTKLKVAGVLGLYLPHPSQSYWRPYVNRKHLHVMQPEIIQDYLVDRGWNKIFVSGVDLNNSFMVLAEKLNTIKA